MNPALSGALTRYRIMANIVGVLLVVLVLVGVPLKYLTDGQTHEIGEWITEYLGIAHGWLYMIFLFSAFHLSRKARWELGFTIVTLLCGTVPILSFWSEHRATALTRGQALLAQADEAPTNSTTTTSTTTSTTNDSINNPGNAAGTDTEVTHG